MTRKVAIYARVSTEHEAQISALGNQMQYYDEILERHPEYELYEKYIDEGITGTSTAKRDSFNRMITDAESGCFDLIITREVSRFARNTVDTLQWTRKLKALGVEVWFTEDNIFTMDDSDGELRLTIMATLAQNESKKISSRVKAGQLISFKNGVPYGNGNILGYDKLPNHGGYVINSEQAETVRLIYDLYLSGKGLRYIQFELEQRGRKTATGLTNWSCANIGRILKNPFYCGILEYRKQYVPDYLEQKKINNHGAVERIRTKGNHEPIVTEEEFDLVQARIEKKRQPAQNQTRRIGQKEHADIWGDKLVCSCGRKLNRVRYHTSKSNEITYAYQCASQKETGTVKTRMKRGLPIDGVCRSQFVQGWKLEVQASVIFSEFFNNKSAVLKLANDLFEANSIVIGKKDKEEKELSKLNDEITALQKKIDKLLDLRLSGEIDRDDYSRKREELDSLISMAQERVEEISKCQDIEESIEARIRAMKAVIDGKEEYDFERVPEEIIDVFVEKIVVYEDYLEWHLRFDNDTRLKMSCIGQKRNAKVITKDETTQNCLHQHRLQSRTRSNITCSLRSSALRLCGSPLASNITCEK